MIPASVITKYLPKMGKISFGDTVTEFFKVLLPKIQSGDLLMEIFSKYKIVNPEVIKFVRHEPLASFLATEAYQEIRKYFPDEDLILDFTSDPESNSQLLVLYIRTQLEPEEALKRLRKLDEEWWLDKASEYKDICIHLQMA